MLGPCLRSKLYSPFPISPNLWTYFCANFFLETAFCENVFCSKGILLWEYIFVNSHCELIQSNFSINNKLHCSYSKYSFCLKNVSFKDFCANSFYLKVLFWQFIFVQKVFVHKRLDVVWNVGVKLDSMQNNFLNKFFVQTFLHNWFLYAYLFVQKSLL